METRRYDITGNLVTASTSCCQQTSINYTSDTQYAYPQSQTRGSSDPNSAIHVTTSATYDFNTGLGLSATDPNGRTSQTSYFVFRGLPVASLTSFKEAEGLRIRRMAAMAITPEQASHVILTALRRGIISSLQLPKVCRAWEEPVHEEFTPRTAWSLFNAFTEVLKPRAVAAPQAFVAQTIRLNGLMLPEATDAPQTAA